MACNLEFNCSNCFHDTNCVLERYGEGTSYCAYFLYHSAHCERTKGILFKDELEEIKLNECTNFK